MRHLLFASLAMGWVLVGCAGAPPYAGTCARIAPGRHVLGQQVFEMRVDQVDQHDRTVAPLWPTTQWHVDERLAWPGDLFVATTTLTSHHVVDALDTYPVARSAFAVVDE